MSSSLPEGHPVEYDIEELKYLLKNKLQVAEEEASWEEKKLANNQHKVVHCYYCMYTSINCCLFRRLLMSFIELHLPY